AEYEASGGTRATTLQGTDMTIIVLHTLGARSGKLRKSPLMKVEHEGQYALVGSQGGAPVDPNGCFNLRADPTAVAIQDGPEPFPVVVHEATGEERSIWWERAVAAYPPYAEYQERTDRTIPVYVARRRLPTE